MQCWRPHIIALCVGCRMLRWLNKSEIAIYNTCFRLLYEIPTRDICSDRSSVLRIFAGTLNSILRELGNGKDICRCV
jgi:hypothetical protein